MENEIRAVYDESTIRVYQAFNDDIAKEAIKNGTFGKSFKMNRMTWIKPSFLWMMYRCGWGTKDDQTNILAIDIKREAFDFIVQNAVISKYEKDIGMNKSEWQEKIKKSEIRVQWDPERNISGNPLNYRSIQLGIRGSALHKYVNDWIVKITDITEYVENLRIQIENKIDIKSQLPEEKVYRICD